MAGGGPPEKASVMEGRREEHRGESLWAVASIHINSQVLLLTLAKDERKV